MIIRYHNLLDSDNYSWHANQLKCSQYLQAPILRMKYEPNGLQSIQCFPANSAI